MKHFRRELWFNTPHRRNYINITPTDSENVNKTFFINILDNNSRVIGHGYGKTKKIAEQFAAKNAIYELKININEYL